MHLKDGFICSESGKLMLAEDIVSFLEDLPKTKRNKLKGFPIFDTKTLEPSIIIKRDESPFNPKIKILLGAKKNKKVFPILLKQNKPIDYLIQDNVWNPLPQGTLVAFQEICDECGIKHKDDITVGSYLKLITKNDVFHVHDETNEQLYSSKLQKVISQDKTNNLNAKPYEYQKIGISWISFMASQNVGCILADEMGLGKTLQIIGYLVNQIETGQKKNLIICPATLIENWRREIEKFAPQISIVIHSGAKRRGVSCGLIEGDVCISSYDTVLSDISIFKEVKWGSVVLDEAQNIKNPNAKRTLAIKALPRNNSVAVTGTPIENKIIDAWSISDFVFPSYLGKEKQFEEEFENTIRGASRLKPFLSVLMLRRRVSEVANDLPPRIDIPVPLELDNPSKKIYERIRLSKSNSLFGPEILTYLRMFCAHPWLQREFLEMSPLLCSTKLQRCLEICDEIRASNSKVIIFTSFSESIEILKKTISESFGVNIQTISGKTPIQERQQLVDAFNNSKTFSALILNPKAGGVGLNITGANHVIHYNLEWNPSVEDQASARAYRRGQMQTVTIHRLFYVNTVEEIISKRMELKRAISEMAAGKADKSDEEANFLLEALKESPIRHRDENI